MIWFLQVAIAVAWVENYMWSRHEFGDSAVEQSWLRESAIVMDFVAEHYPELLPTVLPNGESISPDWEWL